MAYVNPDLGDGLSRYFASCLFSTTSENDQDQRPGQDHQQTIPDQQTRLPISSACLSKIQFRRDHNSRFTKNELSDICRSVGWRVTGNKPFLSERLGDIENRT